MTEQQPPRLLSINVGRPRRVEWNGREYQTAFLKQSVAGPVEVRRLGLDGDGQANQRAHGGVWQALYAYPVEHYAYWRQGLGREAMAHGFFGENLTIAGLSETSVRVGDILTSGGVVLAVTHPRRPCATLEGRIGQRGFAKQFQQSGRSGFYMRVLQEGLLDLGKELVHEVGNPDALSIAQLLQLRHDDTNDAKQRSLLQRAAEDDALTPDWRTAFRARLEKLD